MDKLEWPEWETVYDYWKTLDVPEVQIVKFEIGEHYNSYVSAPWVELKSNRQFPVSNPQSDTAAHICRKLNNVTDEMKALFKIHTFVKTEGLNRFDHESISTKWMESGGMNNFGWGQNAKNLLPLEYVTIPDHYQDLWRFEGNVEIKNEPESWKEIIEACALAWTAISEQLGVIRLPDWMDKDSDEYKNYQAFVSVEHDKRDRLEYERLKRKFEVK